jgi:hypothetical protein
VTQRKYEDDLDALWDDNNCPLIIDSITRNFETVSGQILNRNRKSAIIYVGTWSGRPVRIGLSKGSMRQYSKR